MYIACVALFISIIPSYKRNMNNSFRIIIVKINMVKGNINIIKIYIKKNYIITKNVPLSEFALTKTISS